MDAPEGLLLVDKPRGWTSHDVVAVVRKRFPRGTKVGHSGTLDPMATGLLILLIGRATKQAGLYQGLPKVYSGTMRLGVETDSGDLDGRIIKESPVPDLDAAALAEAFRRRIGEIEFVVPAFSAVKHEGKPLYQYARRGIAVPEKRRITTVRRWDLTAWNSPEASFLLDCSSGTYVRALAGLIGEEFGCGAALSSLRRDSVGDFDLATAVGPKDEILPLLPLPKT